MIGEGMMLAGAAIMMTPRRTRFVLDPVPGEALRQVYAEAVVEPVPYDMIAMTKRIANLRIVSSDGRRQS